MLAFAPLHFDFSKRAIEKQLIIRDSKGLPSGSLVRSCIALWSAILPFNTQQSIRRLDDVLVLDGHLLRLFLTKGRG